MADQRIPLSALFGAVAQSMAENQAYLNSLDDKDGDAGNNYVHNWQVVQQAVTQAERRDADAGTAMMMAARALQRQGQGQTAQMYSAGLARAATQFAGQNGVSLTDFLPLLSGLLGGMQGTTNRRPGEGSPMDALLPGILGYLAAKQQGADDQQALMSALGQAMGMTGMAGGGQRGYAAPQPGGGLGDLLGSLLGGGMAAPAPQPQPQSPLGGGGGLLGPLLEQLLGGGGVSDTPAPAPAPPPQAPRQRSAPRQAPPPEQNPNLGLEELLKGLLAGPQGGAPSQSPSAPQIPFGRDYQPPAQPDPGAAGGAALLEGLLRGLMGGQAGSEDPGMPAPSRPAAPMSPRIGRRGDVSEA